MSELANRCTEALLACGVPPAKLLVRYMERLLDWNQKVNLTGADNPEDLALKHIADVWIALQALNRPNKPIYDIGSGGGIPGLILAVILPESQVTLVERRTKKAAVLEKIVDELGLQQRVRVFGKAFEDLRPLPQDAEYWFRGFLPGIKLGTYLSDSFPQAAIGQLVLMKGPAWPNEKVELMNIPKLKPAWRERFAEAVEIPYQLPKGAGERILVLV